MDQRMCRCCGGWFDVYHCRHIFCSRACHDAAHGKRGAKGPARCATCLVVFEKGRPKSKYCSKKCNQAAYVARHRDRLLAEARARYENMTPERRAALNRYSSEYQKQRRVTHPEQVRLRKQLDYVRNRTKCLSRCSAYAKKNRPSVYARQAKWRQENAEHVRKAAWLIKVQKKHGELPPVLLEAMDSARKAKWQLKLARADRAQRGS
jgi:hypothetical protein